MCNIGKRKYNQGSSTNSVKAENQGVYIATLRKFLQEWCISRVDQLINEQAQINQQKAPSYDPSPYLRYDNARA